MRRRRLVPIRRDLNRLLRQHGSVRPAIIGDRMLGWDAVEFARADLKDNYGPHLNLNVSAEDAVPVIEVPGLHGRNHVPGRRHPRCAE